MREIESEHVLQMSDSSSEELLREIREKHQAGSLAKVAVWGTAGIFMLLLLGGAAAVALGVALAVGAAAFIAGHFADQMRKSVVLFYDFDSEVAAHFEQLHAVFKLLQSAQRVWHVSAEGDVHDRKRNAGASTAIRRHPVRPVVSAPPFLKTNVEVPSLGVGRQTLYFLPDRLLVYDGRNVGAVGYPDLRVDRATVRFIEDQGVAADSQVVDRTWRYVNKSGGPDRRFSNNHEIPICLYEQLDLTSPSGLRERIQLSRVGVAAGLPQAISRLALAKTKGPEELLPHVPARESHRSPAPTAPAHPQPVREPGGNIGTASDRYYGLLAQMQQAQRARDYPAAIRAARESFAVLAPWVNATKRDFGTFTVSSIPCLEVAGTLMAVCGDKEGLGEMRRAVQVIPDLAPWNQAVVEHENDAATVDRMLVAIQAEPGLRQRDLKTRIGTEDGRRPARLAEWLEKAGRIRREREGSTYRLYAAPRRDQG